MSPASGRAAPGLVLRLCRLLLSAAAAVLPARCRPPFRESWEGELAHRFHHLARTGDLTLRTQIDLLARCFGAFSHALWLAGREWRSEPVIQDLRYALRSLTRRPGFAAVALVSLALGIGANTVIFSIVDGVLLHPFPFPEVDRLVNLGASFPQLGGREGFIEALSAPEVNDVESQSRTLEEIFAFDLGNRDLGGIDEPQRLFSAFVWQDPFPTLGMSPALGRGFSAEEIARQEPVAILSHRVWRERLGGDPAAVGRPITINGEPRTLVGVMPPELSLLGTDLWLPMWADRDELPRERRQFTVLARLADGATLEEARAELATLARRIEAEHGAEREEYAGWRLGATPFVDVWAGFVGPAGLILLAAVGFVLLIACANLASLLLARATARSGEIAVRSALGAARTRLVRQLLTESALLSVSGGLLGLLLAYTGVEAVVSLLPVDRLPGHFEIGVDARVLWFSAGLTLLSGLLFGLAPALVGSRVDLGETLKAEGGRAGRGGRSRLLQKGLVVVEIALAVVLMAGAGLTARSFARLRAVDPGVDVDGVLTMRLTLPWERYEGEGIIAFFEDLVERAGAIPGVTRAAVTSQFPPRGFSDTQLQVEGREIADEGRLPTADITVVSPGLFETLGVSLLQGRTFSSVDTADAPLSVVVNRTFAERYLPGRQVLGTRLVVGPPDADRPPVTVVGVVADTRNHGVDRPTEPEIFLSLAQSGGWNNQLFLLLRTTGDPTSYLPSVRDAIRAIDPNQPVYAVATLAERFDGAVFQRRLAAGMLVAFALLALSLAAVGIYGLLSYTVARSTREIGIRLALGAGRERVLRQVVRQAAVLLALGLGLGLAGALALSRALASLLFGVSATDPLTLAAVAALLALTGLAAGYLPARRAARQDPVAALRYE